MSWQGITGHDDVVEQFRRCLQRQRLASTFLFVGPEGVGKRSFALKLAQVLLCRQSPIQQMHPCGQCPSCRQVESLSHPDLELVSKPADKSVIPLELFIGARERRSQEGLCHNIALKPFMGDRKVAVIDDADHLGVEGANCLLKTLEEPPPGSMLILISTSPQKQLPTIRSRCQLIRFQPLDSRAVEELLLSKELIEDPTEARRLAQYSEGSLSRALELSDPALWEFRSSWLEGLARTPLESRRLAAAVSAFVDEAGKEAPPRRARARQVAGFAAEFYRQVFRILSQAPASDDEELRTAASKAAASWSGDEETAAACADRCLETLQHIDRNVNQSTLIEAWLDDLGQITATGRAQTSGVS